jgi:hypothetical protein
MSDETEFKFNKHDIPTTEDLLQDECEPMALDIVTYADYFGEGDVVTVYAVNHVGTGAIVEINDWMLVIEELAANYESHFFAMDKINCIKLIKPAGDGEDE